MENHGQQTRSHVLAASGSIRTNEAPLSHDRSVIDIGWNQKPDHNAKAWVDGCHNEDVWALVRRMNKEVLEIRKIDHIPCGNLDLMRAQNVVFSPIKLRSEVERLYMGMILSVISFTKTFARLRSWREPRRTGAFCIAYFAAWYLDCLMFLISCAAIVTITFPEARRTLFPHAPLSMVDIGDGSAAKPMAGTLGSLDSATGAPQNLRGESVENEASNFVTSVAAIATNILTGEDPQGAPNEVQKDSNDGFRSTLDVSLMAVMKDKAEGVDRPSEDKTKAPMQETIWKQMTPLLDMLILTSDTWERLSNMLVPTPPFHNENHQRRLAMYVTPIALASVLLSRDTALKGATFFLGLFLFGDPLSKRGYRFIVHNNWSHHFYLTTTLFNGVPTNLQLALTLLRMGEAHQAPLPPPVHIHEAPPDEAIDVEESFGETLGDDRPLGASHHVLEDIAEHNPEMADHAGGEDTEVEQVSGHGKKREKMFAIFKEGAKGVVKTVAAADKLRARAGAENAKLRAGVQPSSYDGGQIIGPVEFSARYDGKKGYVYVNSGAEVPFIAFNTNSLETNSDLHTVWSIPINEITQLRKHSGYGMLNKLAAGWAADGPIYDSLRIVDGESKNWVVTALPHRDALFNRLCAIDRQAKWEVW